MTTRETIQKLYLKWLAETGIPTVPEVKLADWDPVPGVEPPLLIKWKGNRGNNLDQSAEWIAQDIRQMDGGIDNKMNVHRFEVHACVGGEIGANFTVWLDASNPPPPPPPPISPLGPEWPKEYVARFSVDQTRTYHSVVGAIPEGAVYVSEGKRYLCFRPTPFALWFVKLQ